MGGYCLCKHVIKGLELEDDKYYGIALSVALLRSPALVEWSAIESLMSFGNVDCYWYLEYKAFTLSLPLYHYFGPHPAAGIEKHTFPPPSEEAAEKYIPCSSTILVPHLTHEKPTALP